MAGLIAVHTVCVLTIHNMAITVESPPLQCRPTNVERVDQRGLRSETIRQVLDDVGWSDASHHSQNERQNVTNTVLYEAQCALESTVGD